MAEEQRESGWRELATALQVMFSQPLLAVMMFLQYAIWGAWEPPLSGILVEKLGFTGFGLALIYNALPIMNLLAPFTAGQVADRLLPAQTALGIFHILGGIVMLILSTQKQLETMLPFMLIYALFYAPTLALTNSIAFQHLRDPQRQFGPIRVWGTIGWIVAGWILSLFRSAFGSADWAVIDVFVLAGVFSISMGLISFALPHTPPAKEAADPLAFREALVLLKDRNYLTFFIIAFVVATELRLYYMLTFPFLQEAGRVVGITERSLPAWMTIAQIAEIFTITFLLPYALPRWGVRTSLLVGIVAWPIRYIIFAITWAGHQAMPWLVWLSIAALALHGFCYVFFFVVAFIYTDMVAPRDIRSSAQALINFAVLGVGLLIGGFFAGFLKDIFTYAEQTNYTWVFTIPAIITLLCAVAFAALFREEKRR
ncbi:MAG: MFS transporter [Armatimonadetes bacterium]|nr:MFS transporter [Armatimonadota bacterium]